MTAADAASLSSWESIANFGTWLVIIGVAGEGLEILFKICEHKFRENRFLKWCGAHEFWIDILGGICWIMVVIGLVMELRGSNEAQLIVKQENARVTKEAGEAVERAGNAEKQAGHANERAAQLEKDAQSFRLKADSLEKELAAIEPLNQPINSLFAVASITLSDVPPWPEAQEPLKWSARLVLEEAAYTANGWIELTSEKLNRNRFEVPGNARAHLYDTSFTEPETREIPMIYPQLWWETRTQTVRVARSRITNVILRVSDISIKNCDVVWGNVELRNGATTVQEFRLTEGEQIRNGNGELHGTAVR